MMPTEVASTAGLEFLGIDPINVTQAIVVVEPPKMGPPQFGIVLELATAFDLEQLPQQARQHTEATEVGGRPYFKSQMPMLPGFFMPDDHTLFIATHGMLQKQFSKQKNGAETALATQVKTRAGNEDFYLLLDVQAVMPYLEMGMAQATAGAPPEAQQFLEAPRHVKLAEVALHFTTPGNTQLVLHANNAGDADKLEGLVDKAIEMAATQMQMQSQMMLASEDPFQAAMGRYGMRVADKLYEPYRPTRNGEQFLLFNADLNAPGSEMQLASIGIIGILVALLLPAVQAAREAARRTQSQNNLKMLNFALLNYEATHGKFPAHASYNEDGKPLLSWRVHMLPYLEQRALYEQFRLDEPWDSEHNKKLIPLMPPIFAAPSSTLDPSEGKTNYVAPIGEGFVFDGTQHTTTLREIRDGSSNTVWLLEADDEAAVTWTKPEDLKFDEEDPLKGLFELRNGQALVGFVDGSVRTIGISIDFEMLKALFTKAGGEVVDRF